MSNPTDHFVQEGERRYAGRHLLVDFKQCQAPLTDAPWIRAMLAKACEAAGCKVLMSYGHPFPGEGVTALVVLAESHASIHTWPEHKLACIDLFMCGDTEPRTALKLLALSLRPRDTVSRTIRRGEL